MKHIRVENGLGVRLLQTNKFKTNVITVLIRTELTDENATNNAVLAGVMRSGCQRYRSRLEIAKRCEELFGAEIEIGVVKKGEQHLIQLYMEILNDGIDGRLFASAGELLNALLFCPLVENGAFRTEYVERQKERQREIIVGRTNDKKKYARERCIEVMCEAERFGVPGDGREELLELISPESLFSHYQNLLKSSPIEIGIIGGVDEACCLNWARRYMSRGIESGIEYSEPATILRMKSGLKEVKERLDLRQGKLVLGIRCDFSPGGEDFYKFLLFNEILGGGASSRLFRRIREERSLCYYINSLLFRAKAIMLIQAGIDESDYKETLGLIIEQLELLKKGGAQAISSGELEQAKASLTGQMENLADSPQGLTDFYMTNAQLNDDTDISSLRGVFGRCTVDDMRLCARGMAVDTAYFLV